MHIVLLQCSWMLWCIPFLMSFETQTPAYQMGDFFLRCSTSSLMVRFYQDCYICFFSVAYCNWFFLFATTIFRAKEGANWDAGKADSWTCEKAECVHQCMSILSVSMYLCTLVVGKTKSLCSICYYHVGVYWPLCLVHDRVVIVNRMQSLICF